MAINVQSPIVKPTFGNLGEIVLKLSRLHERRHPMGSAIVNLIASIIVAISAILVVRSSVKVSKMAKNSEELMRRQIDRMNDGSTSMEETL